MTGAPTIRDDDPLAIEVTEVIRGGDITRLRALLTEHPHLAGAQIADVRCDDTRSLLHVAADWPGHFPNGPDVVRALVEAGSEVDARGGGKIGETPLHWAASSDDVAVLDALLDAGATIDAPGAIIAGGPPLEDAVAFGQWNAARRLAERGAAVAFREAAALGLLDAVRARSAEAGPDDLSMAFWYACHGGQPATAELLHGLGAEIDWIAPWDGSTPLDAAIRSEAGALVGWLRARGARNAAELG